jgi:hypothetical protein
VSERAQPLFFLGCDTTGLLKVLATLMHTHNLSHPWSTVLCLLPSQHLKKKEGWKEERGKRK